MKNHYVLSTNLGDSDYFFADDLEAMAFTRSYASCMGASFSCVLFRVIRGYFTNCLLVL